MGYVHKEGPPLKVLVFSKKYFTDSTAYSDSRNRIDYYIGLRNDKFVMASKYPNDFWFIEKLSAAVKHYEFDAIVWDNVAQAVENIFIGNIK
jgi:hypothetical protein